MADKDTLCISEIINSLPHRYPFLLIDRVLSLEVDKTILAIKNVTINEPFFVGHFPIRPIMPGVLIIEALAQAAAILAYKSTEWEPDKALFYLGSIDNARFKKIVSPGDQLQLRINVMNRKHTVWKFKGEAYVSEQLVCSTEMTSVKGER